MMYFITQVFAVHSLSKLSNVSIVFLTLPTGINGEIININVANHINSESNMLRLHARNAENLCFCIGVEERINVILKQSEK